MIDTDQQAAAFIVDRLVNAAGEWGRAGAPQPRVRAEVRKLVGDMVRGFRDNHLQWSPTFDEDDEYGDAFGHAGYICASVGAEAAYSRPDAWAYLHEAWQGYHAIQVGDDPGDWLDRTAGFGGWLDPPALPRQADDLLLLFGIPDDIARADALSAVQPFAMACSQARLQLEVEDDVFAAEADYGNETAGSAAGIGIALAAFASMEHDGRPDAARGRSPADSRMDHCRVTSATMDALADALLEARSAYLPASVAMFTNVARELRGEAVDHEGMVGVESQAVLDDLVDFFQRQAQIWGADPGRRAHARFALAAAEHCNQVAYRVSRGDALSFPVIVPFPPDPYLDSLAHALQDAPADTVRTAKRAWADACVTAAAALHGFAARAERDEHRDAMLFGARAMARRALGVNEHPIRLADFAYSPLV